MVSRFTHLVLAAALLSASLVSAGPGRASPRKRDTSTPTCFAPATKLPPPKAADVQSAIASANDYLLQLSQTAEVDSVVAAVVTPDGSIYEGTYGVLRANETNLALQGTVTRDSIYRLASISKIFTAWQAYILRDRGVLGLDDKVSKYLPTFKLDTTVRQLATHMSGIPGTLPAGNMSDWPHGFDGSGSPPDNGLPFPTEAQTIAAINAAQLMVAPYTYPLYSDTAYGILGLVNAAADGKVNGQLPALVQRDIFGPLNMTASSYVVPPSRNRLVVSSSEPAEADYDFLNTMDGAGGMLGSLADLIKSQQVLLNPARSGSNISPYTVREWMRPLYSFADDFFEVGHVWEIVKRTDAAGRTYRVYEKNGALVGFHTLYALNPDSGYGVIVLMSGSNPDPHGIAWHLQDIFQPAVDSYRAAYLKSTYAGSYVSADGKTQSTISVRNGGLYADTFVLDGEDILADLQGPSPQPVALWPVAEDGLTFRLSFGLPGLNGAPNYGCILEMVGFDPGYSRGKAIGLVQFGTGTLSVPSTGAKLTRA